jgi:hypothetical protein
MWPAVSGGTYLACVPGSPRCVSAECRVGIRIPRMGGMLAEDRPLDLDDETAVGRRDPDDAWPQLNPLELAVCLADGQPRPPEHPLDTDSPAG